MVMVRTNLDGCMGAQLHGCMHIHRTKIVTTMSGLPASGLDKNRDGIMVLVLCTSSDNALYLSQNL